MRAGVYAAAFQQPCDAGHAGSTGHQSPLKIGKRSGYIMIWKRRQSLSPFRTDQAGGKSGILGIDHSHEEYSDEGWRTAESGTDPGICRASSEVQFKGCDRRDVYEWVN